VKAEGFEDVGIAPAVKIAQLDGAERAGVAPCRLGLVRRRPEAVEGDDDLAGKMVEFETASAGKRAKKPSSCPMTRRGTATGPFARQNASRECTRAVSVCSCASGTGP